MGQQSAQVNQSQQVSHVQPARRPPGRLSRFLKTPKGYVVWMLLVLMLVGALYAPDRRGVENVGIAVGTALALDMVFAMVRGQTRILSDGGLVTGLIIGLVLSAATPIWITVLTTATAIVAKHAMKSGRKPWFNPAAVGLLLTAFVFHTGQSWWGDLADLPVVFIVVLLVLGFLLVGRINKFPQVLSFLGTYFAILTAMAYLHWGHAAFTPGDALRTPLINSALFMAFFMLTDPPTSPAKYKDQVFFGFLTAGVGTAVYLLSGGLTYWLVGLLVANAWKAWSSRRQVASNTLKQPVRRATG